MDAQAQAATQVCDGGVEKFPIVIYIYGTGERLCAWQQIDRETRIETRERES